jgi:CRP-like cAMP-binding protein
MLKSRTGNVLLDSLPAEEMERLASELHLVQFNAGQVLAMQGEAVERVYFPTMGLVSCRATGLQGEAVEIFAVGHDGVVEPAAILTSVAAVTAEVQIAGEAYEIGLDELCEALHHTPELTRRLLKYAYSLAVRMVQATKCALFHTVQQRLVLWLLLAQRAQGPRIPCTHQAIADALGIRRASVTQVLDNLANEGILQRRRGSITIENRQALEAIACDCFQLIKAGREPDVACNLES